MWKTLQAKVCTLCMYITITASLNMLFHCVLNIYKKKCIFGMKAKILEINTCNIAYHTAI